MTNRTQRAAAVTAAALVLGLALTGCGRLDAHPASTPGGMVGAGGTTASPTSSAPAADDSATLGSITQDLDSADTANTEADSNGQAADQAAASNDEP